MVRAIKLLVVTTALGLAGLGLPAHAQMVTFDSVNLGPAGPGALNLGIFVTGPTSMNASNSGTLFNTNLGLANGASTNFSGGGTLTGILYKDPGATVQNNIAQQFNIDGGIVTQSLAAAVTAVQTAASNATQLGLTPDQTFGSLGSTATTINLTKPDTVVDVNGNIAVTNPSGNLTINGTANDRVIINVTGSISVTNGQITATGGIPASHILFNVEGSGVSVSNGISVITGTYLAPNSGQKITISPGTVNGAIIAYTISTSSGPTVNGAPYVPAPSSLILMGLGGLAFVGLVVVRSRRSPVAS